MLKDAKYRCTLSGIPFSYERIPGARVRPWVPSIDRIDNSLGYSVSNCRLVCAYVNLALNAFGLEAFDKVVRHMKGHRRKIFLKSPAVPRASTVEPNSTPMQGTESNVEIGVADGTRTHDNRNHNPRFDHANSGVDSACSG